MKKHDFYESQLTGAGLSVGKTGAKQIVELCKNYRSDMFLDIGCGDGFLTELLSEALQAAHVYGVELSTEGVTSSKARGIECLQFDFDGTDIPYKDNLFDFIFCGAVIEHLFDPDHFLDEIYRMLTPKGHALIVTPNLASWRSRFAMLLGYQPFASSASLVNADLGKLVRRGSSGREHIRLMTTRALKELLIFHSFKVIELHGSAAEISHYFVNPAAIVLSATQQLFSKFPSLADQVIAIVEK
jgi:methionine biosynthesis protein MetW